MASAIYPLIKYGINDGKKRESKLKFFSKKPLYYLAVWLMKQVMDQWLDSLSTHWTSSYKLVHICYGMLYSVYSPMTYDCYNANEQCVISIWCLQILSKRYTQPNHSNVFLTNISLWKAREKNDNKK